MFTLAGRKKQTIYPMCRYTESIGLKHAIYLISGGEGTSYNDLYGEALPERATFFRLQVYERVGKSVMSVG